MDRIKDNVSLDHMARLLVDVQQDSSSIVDSIISQHQRELLNLIFLGDAPNRNKVKFFRYFYRYFIETILRSSVYKHSLKVLAVARSCSVCFSDYA
jgi:hypothetical protein